VAETDRATKEPERREAALAGSSGVWYPRWYWPSFALPAFLWLAVFFILPFYVVLGVAFGTVGASFREPVPYLWPGWWQFDAFGRTIQKFYAGSAIYLDPLINTFTYVIAASTICLVLGYCVAYYTARHAGRWKGLILVLLVSPFWISYLMRIYAWQGLLQEDGFINDFIVRLHLSPTPIEWLTGNPITVILGLVYGYIPFMILPLYGSLDRINTSLLEAGRDLGASPAQTFRRVTLPLSKQAILAGLVIVSLPMFGDYYTNDLLSESPNTAMLGNLLDGAVGQAGQGPAAGTLVLVLMAIVLVPMLYYLRETKRETARK
jgi:ABC-type spermidine/putrescine transport system permease subunit I